MGRSSISLTQWFKLQCECGYTSSNGSKFSDAKMERFKVSNQRWFSLTLDALIKTRRLNQFYLQWPQVSNAKMMQFYLQRLQLTAYYIQLS